MIHLHLHIGSVEAFWFTINLVATALAVVALVNAIRDRRAVKVLNGRANEMQADREVRRERYRLIVQVLLLIIVIPQFFLERDIQLNPGLLVLLAVPVVLLVASAHDAYDRRKLLREYVQK